MKTKEVRSRDLGKGLRAEDHIPDVVRSSEARRRAQAKKAKIYMLEVLRWAAKKSCNRRNCGTACLCEPCAARKALEYYDPKWRAR